MAVKFGKYEVRTRTIVGVTIVIVVLVAACLLYSQMGEFYLIRKMARQNPDLRIMPTPLADTSIYMGEMKTYSAFGEEFELPWEDMDKVTEKYVFHAITFKSGIAVTVLNPNEPGATPGGVTSGQTSDTKVRMLTSVGVMTDHPNYEFLKNALYTNPDAPFTFSRQRAYRNFISVLTKEFAMPKSSYVVGGIRALDMGPFKGFQYGDPIVSDIVQLKLFDDSDRQIEIWIARKGGLKRYLNQAQINRMIKSLDRVQNPAATNTASSPVSSVH